MEFCFFVDFLLHIQSRFYATGKWTAPSVFSVGKSASWPFPSDILFRSRVYRSHSIFKLLCTDFECSDPALPFSSNQTTVIFILLLLYAVKFHKGCYFYRNFLGLHQMRKDLVVCCLIRHMNISNLLFYFIFEKSRLFWANAENFKFIQCFLCEKSCFKYAWPNPEFRDFCDFGHLQPVQWLW